MLRITCWNGAWFYHYTGCIWKLAPSANPHINTKMLPTLMLVWITPNRARLARNMDHAVRILSEELGIYE